MNELPNFRGERPLAGSAGGLSTSQKSSNTVFPTWRVAIILLGIAWSIIRKYR